MRIRNLLWVCVVVLVGLVSTGVAAPKVDPELTARLAADADQLCVILTFHGSRVTDEQAAAVSALGITTGVRMVNFPIMAVNATPAQIARLLNWDALRSVYLNTPLQLHMNQTRPLIGVNRLLTDAALTARNGGLPVSGRSVTIAISDSGIDGSHQDLKFNPLNAADSKTVQNVLVNPNDEDGLLLRADSVGNPLQGILPPTYVENVVNTDTHVGHGTHVAGIAAGTGQASGGRYAGVAQGARLLGLGSGGALFVLGQVAAFDYVYTHQFEHNIRVVNCSWGNSAVAVDPDHPINVATKILHDESHVVVVFANGNDGPRPNSQSRWASVPWIISAGASTKEGALASFSSRGIFGDSIIRPTLLAPGAGGPTDKGYTSAIVAARASTNVVATGADADAEIPPAFVPFYTQIIGTSMAAPHLAGVVASILEANPNLTPGEVRSILERTATPLAPYDQFEAGAGLANVHAAVDLAFNPQKPYGEFGFNGKGLSLSSGDEQKFEGTVPSRSTTTHTFSVPPNTRFTFVQLDWEGSIGEDELVIDNTNIVINDLGLTVLNGSQQVARSDAANLVALFGAREAVKLEFPSAGTYTARVSSGFPSGQGAPLAQPYRLKVVNYTFDPNQVSDLASLNATTQARALRLVYDRVMVADNGFFRPSDALTRIELGRALMFAARVPQYIPNRPTFTDIAAGTPDALVAESLRRENVLGLSSGTSFGAATQVSRLEEAVALVRALRLDAQARQLANTNVTVNGQVITDNARIPAALRGYVQLALDRGLLQAFPAEVREVGTGEFLIIPGPRFEPERVVTRAEFVEPATRLLSQLFGE